MIPPKNHKAAAATPPAAANGSTPPKAQSDLSASVHAQLAEQLKSQGVPEGAHEAAHARLTEILGGLEENMRKKTVVVLGCLLAIERGKLSKRDACEALSMSRSDMRNMRNHVVEQAVKGVASYLKAQAKE